MAENLVELAKESDRIWLNDTLLKNNEEAISALKTTVDNNKNLLFKEFKITNEESETAQYLRKIAEKSFEKESAVYKRDKNFYEAMNEAFTTALSNKKASLYLNAAYEGETLGIKLSNLFYTGSINEKMDIRYESLLRDLAKLDVK